MGTKRSELFGIFNERLTVIGKGQRHKPVAGQPTTNDTKQYGILEFLGGRGRRKCDRFIPICCLQCTQPTARVEYRGLWVSGCELSPSIILQGVDLVDDGVRTKKRDRHRRRRRSQSPGLVAMALCSHDLIRSYRWAGAQRFSSFRNSQVSESNRIRETRKSGIPPLRCNALFVMNVGST